jgi:hypothetical protein
MQIERLRKLRKIKFRSKGAQTLYSKFLQSKIVAKNEKIKKVADLVLTETKKKEKN